MKLAIRKRSIFTVGFPLIILIEGISWLQDNTFRSIIWGACGAWILILLTYVASFEVRIEGDVLKVGALIGRKAVRLDLLSRVEAFSTGRNGKGWKISLTDQTGAQLRFGLNGIDAAKRRDFLDYLMQRIECQNVEKAGPVAWLFENSPWFPRDT